MLRTEIWATVCLCNVHGAAGCGGRPRRTRASSWGVRQSAGYRHITGLWSKSKCRFEGPKVALRRHSTGTTRSPHDLVIDAEKDSFFELGAGRRLRFRWSAGYRHITGLWSKSKCRFEGPKVALRRHSTGTTRSPHDLVIDAEKDSFFERGAGCGGYASGGVPVTGAFPDFGQSRSAGLRPSKWHFAGT